VFRLPAAPGGIPSRMLGLVDTAPNLIHDLAGREDVGVRSHRRKTRLCGCRLKIDS
jgi:hypothetical protein